jgi:hypothetical protein
MSEQISSYESYTVGSLLTNLDQRIESDCKRMGRWRTYHRFQAVFSTFVAILVPAFLVSGLLPETDRMTMKILLLLVAFFGGVNAAFQPGLHSALRRRDMNISRKLGDDYRAAVLEAKEDPARLLDTYRRFSEAFETMYAERGHRLIESTLRSPDKNLLK